MYIFMYTKNMLQRYSIAEARAHLPMIVDQAESGVEVELTRRGRAVAVLVSRQELDRLRGKGSHFREMYRKFLEKYSVKGIGLENDFIVSMRDISTGRKVSLLASDIFWTQALFLALYPKCRTAIVKRLDEHGPECAIAAAVWHELTYGCRRLPKGKRRTAIEAYLRDVVHRSFPNLPYDEAAATWHGQEDARLEALGKPAPFVDGQIAAVAHVHGQIGRAHV